MFQVKPIETTASDGVQILGLTSQDIDNPLARTTLCELWIKCGLIVFRGLEGTELQVRLSEVFGPCQVHPTRAIDKSDGHPKIFKVEYDPVGGDVYEIDGVSLGAWLPWHSDLVYMAKINHGGLLAPVELPSSGGLTGFIDQRKVFDALPDRLKERVQGRDLVYQWELDPAKQKFGARPSQHVTRWSGRRREIQNRIDAGEFPPVVHPMTYTQTQTGRSVLNVSPWFAERIDGVAPEESAALLTEIVAHTQDERHAYFHHWQPGDMVLWDNWSMLHNARGIPAESTRRMQRTTIAGDYEMGRVASGTDRADERLNVTLVI